MIATVLGCVVLAAPLLLFGFGLAEWIGPWVRARGRAMRVALPLCLLVSYLVFALPRGLFRWDMLLGMGTVSVVVTALLEAAGTSEPGWWDWSALALLGISVDLGWFKNAFPVGGLSGLSKLLLVDVGLYGYLVLRPIGGIGYNFRPRWVDLRVGLREFALYTPVAIGIGFALGFLHLHKILATPWWGTLVQVAGGWLFTILVVAIPEELFFRGLMLNMLSRRFGTRTALIVSSVLFGLAHFNKRTAFFNWRYVVLAAIAGVFYARAWLADRRILTSSVTHATVDTVWSTWLR